MPSLATPAASATRGPRELRNRENCRRTARRAARENLRARPSRSTSGIQTREGSYRFGGTARPSLVLPTWAGLNERAQFPKTHLALPRTGPRTRRGVQTGKAVLLASLPSSCSSPSCVVEGARTRRRSRYNERDDCQRRTFSASSRFAPPRPPRPQVRAMNFPSRGATPAAHRRPLA